MGMKTWDYYRSEDRSWKNTKKNKEWREKYKLYFEGGRITVLLQSWVLRAGSVYYKIVPDLTAIFLRIHVCKPENSALTLNTNSIFVRFFPTFFFSLVAVFLLNIFGVIFQLLFPIPYSYNFTISSFKCTTIIFNKKYTIVIIPETKISLLYDTISELNEFP